MAKEMSLFLLTRYFRQGWLNRCYYDGKSFIQPYSAEDRLRVGKFLYEDFLYWQKGSHLASAYDRIKVSGGTVSHDNVGMGYRAERFRRAIKKLSREQLAVVYQIVLHEQEIFLPKNLTVRERLYFNDEIKLYLCRGLDELCVFYKGII